jgi:hypothetical protein
MDIYMLPLRKLLFPTESQFTLIIGFKRVGTDEGTDHPEL